MSSVITPHRLFVVTAAASTLAAASLALADTTTVIEEVPRGAIEENRPIAGGAYEGRSDVKVEQWTEDGKLKQEIHYDDGCRKSVQKDLVTGDEKVVLHEGCTEGDDD